MSSKGAEQSDSQKKENGDNYYYPAEQSHWEKYQLYYLVFGSFLVTIVIVLISNSNTNKQIKKINDRLDGKSPFSSFLSDFGFSSDFSSETSNYLARLKREPFPPYVKKKVEGEIAKIRRNAFGGQTKETKVEQALDKKHFGMRKVKELIIEHLVAKKQAKKNFGEVLCLVGSPGVGKTSIAKSIAQALGRPFERVSLGGVHDEAEIRGHRSTYVSSKPGVIAQALQRAKVKNPVILIDEVDKIGESKYHGNPAAAFLEILDPEQNEEFRDHYLELPIDLSQVMFICTANQMETIPGPLQDRMQIIEIPSYTKDDKQQIAENHLIPQLLKKYNLTNEQLTFENSAIREIIDRYTWEAGIRNLERALTSIIRKFAYKKEKGELKTETITSEKVGEYLGKPTTADLTFEADYSIPGVVNGLSVYNPEKGGGDVLPIEVSCFPGKGEIITTGNLKKTMKESAQVAISYVRKNANQFGINTTDQTKPNFFNFEEKDIHIHVPKGGIPKDGPSAGTALTTAIISALTNKPIGADIGMTGEITLHGQVSGIGGLREKLNAAYRKNLKTIFIPQSNANDLEEVSSELKENLTIIQEDKYSKLLIEGGLFAYGATKGSFILPPHEKEKKHIAGFSPECFYIEKIGEKKIETTLVLRPTSEVLFYEWYRQILQSYQQLPFLYNQWCSSFRAEKNTAPFFRNTEFLWQEGHTIHNRAEEAQQFALSILSDYQNYAENTLCLGVIIGKKTEGEKFAGALETYTVECLLPDGQCLQFATSHYFGLILPFEIAPVQIAFVLVKENKELINYYQAINSWLAPHYRCQLYHKSPRVNLNVLQADKEGCPLKIILGMEELKREEITLVRRDNVERKITILLEDDETEKKFLHAFENNLAENLEKYDSGNKPREQLAAEHKEILNSAKKGLKRDKIIKVVEQEVIEFQKNLYQKSSDFRDKHIYPTNNFAELEQKIKEGIKGLFLIPFCNKLECEIKIKERVPSYSIRCIALGEKIIEPLKCLFCPSVANDRVYLAFMYSLTSCPKLFVQIANVASVKISQEVETASVENVDIVETEEKQEENIKKKRESRHKLSYCHTCNNKSAIYHYIYDKRTGKIEKSLFDSTDSNNQLVFCNQTCFNKYMEKQNAYICAECGKRGSGDYIYSKTDLER
ncbi:11616_t:CDS:2, partial [Funneliformis geosporum]